ncbi:MAG: ATP-binding cassette domain-containing protein [Myxococcota bacterium]
MTTTVTTLRGVGLCKSYGTVYALDGLDIELPGSGITAIIGPNGAGKTTLLNAMTGLCPLDAGRFYLGDMDLTGCPAHHLVGHGISRTFQHVRLVRQQTVLDNVLLAYPDQRGEGLLAALFRRGFKRQEAELEPRARRVLADLGLDGAESQLAGALSYGQQKLLSLACCIATGAEWLLLDEPVAGVHPELIDSIGNDLRELSAAGKRVVFIEHNIDFVGDNADHVIVMDGGRIVAKGEPAEVLARDDILETYLA